MPINLKDLRKDQLVDGFRTVALYLNDTDRTLGARFKHERSGFTVDLLQIESLPQAFVWVNTILNNDSGVAHTQEHLLLGKGNKGRQHGSRNHMLLVEESAGTDQWRTYYHFNTSAGKDVFFKLTKECLDLLLHPDYTDEEVRREVRNFRVKEDSKTKKLQLEEGGSVYNEMVSYENSASNVLWFNAMRSVYGPGHPLSCVNGGSPAGIRKLQADAIRRFHAKNYRLSNMGMIVSLPRSISIDEALANLNASLNDLQKHPSYFSGLTANNDAPAFPQPKPIAPGSIQMVSFADSNNKKPGTIMYIWPAKLNLDVKERMLLQYLLNGLAGDADTPLYKVFVDSKTFKVDSGSTSVGGASYEQQGNPAMISLYDIDQTHMNKKDIETYRKYVVAEIARVAKWKDNSPALKEFNKRVLGTVRQDKRYYGDFVNRPPSFGTRWNSGTLMKQFVRLEHKGGFKRYLTLTPDILEIEKELKSNKNIWRNYIAKWHLLDTVPCAIATKADPSLLKKQESDTQARIAAETERLKKLYGVSDEQEAIKRYKTEYDKTTEQLESLANGAEDLKPADSLPMTFDDQLDYKVSKLAGGIPLVTSTFESMNSANTYLALRLDGVPEKDLMYLAIFPSLLTQVGVIENGKPVSYEKTLERLRNEIYYFNCYYGTNPWTSRYELKVNAAGSNPEEAKRAIAWMELFLRHPYWKVENLPRIRDLVEQSLSGLRGTRDSAYEENWDSALSSAYCWQDVPLNLHTRSFLTKAHDAQRLRWLLKGDLPPEVLKSFAAFMKLMGENCASVKRDYLQKMLVGLEKDKLPALPTDSFKAAISELFDAYLALPGDAKALVAYAATDLIMDLPDIPDDSKENDWKSICNEIAADSQVNPADTLAKLNSIRESLLRKGGARMAFVGSKNSQALLQKSVESVAAGLSDKPFTKVMYSNRPLVFDRLRQRTPGAEKPIFAALVNPRSQYGLVQNKVPCMKYTDLDDKSLTRALAIGLLGGGGAHSLFMKTWGAGLAYGNGPSWSPGGFVFYRADKMPSIPETLRFVAEELKKAKKDPKLVDYTVIGCFSTRAGSDFESRGESIADDLADDITPEKIKNFREAVLKLGKKAEFVDQLYGELLPQYGRIIPGLGVKLSAEPEGKYLAIGDEKQLNLYEDYLKSVEGPETKLYRLYGRDFWEMSEQTNSVAKAAGGSASNAAD